MNYKQKKRIKDSANVAKNVRDLCSNIENISAEYNKDLEVFFSAFVQNFSEKPDDPKLDSEVASSDVMVIDENDSNVHSAEKNDNQKAESELNKSKNDSDVTKKSIDPEIKQLYRKIMQKCHPDRTINDKNISASNKALFAYVLDIAIAAYKNEYVPDLIYAAALVDIYPQSTSMKSCLNQLNQMYSEKSKKIEYIQKSIAWNWGTNWDTLEIRYRIAMRLCGEYNFPPPSKTDVLKFLIDFETK
jgi:hypothetical protein